MSEENTHHRRDARGCPIPDTHDKHTEAHYFIEGMLSEYHNPEPFRWNLNAFLQALRNVTFMLQSELEHAPGFPDWYADQQLRMRSDELLRKFVEGRNIVVKKRSLIINSSADMGIFRNRRLKFVISGDIPPELPSSYWLTERVPLLGLIDPEHTAIGEEYGIRRRWMAPELGDGEILTLCDAAWLRIAKVVAEAHALLGFETEPVPEHAHDVSRCNLLTETDVDPTLPRKWGWR